VDAGRYDTILELLESERDEVLALLGALASDAWSGATGCPGWSVKDIAAHVLGDDVGILARERDGFRAPGAPLSSSWDDLVRFVNERNEAWVAAWRRASPRLLIDLLAVTGPSLWAFYRNLDPDALGAPVSWAGTQPAPNWLRVAREYTERWVHQQQIRDATGTPGLREARWVRPLLDTFAHSLPIALQAVEAPAGTAVALEATGEGGGRWVVARRGEGWQLAAEPATERPSTVVTVEVDTLWRLYTKAIDRDAARARARIEGDAALGERLLAARAIIA
jgi:uncharacterized protein (TIGR03083 family)